MVRGRKSWPVTQLMFCRGPSFSKLYASTKIPARPGSAPRHPFSTRRSLTVTWSIRRVPIGSARIRLMPERLTASVRPNGCPD